MKVQIDAGHGGHDPGASGNGLEEKDITLQVALKIGEILKRYQVEVIYSRTGDEFVGLSDRARIANRAKVDIFVSVHCNSFASPNAQGIEVYAYPNRGGGRVLSKNILNSMIIHQVYTKNRGLKTADFAVLRETNMPATLVELGFISNLEDAGILKNKQDELAQAVARGILDYLGIEAQGDDASNFDDQYEKALKKLVASGVIGSPKVWANLDQVNVNHVKSLVIKMAVYL